MSGSGESWKTVHYEFRPSKQVERKMLLDTFLHLMSLGYKICDYQYTGMGSIHFVDYILFHRYLGINNFISAECNNAIKKRVQFNQPYKNVKIRCEDIGDTIASLSTDEKHILWLDYDGLITRAQINSIVKASVQLSQGSILLVTADAEPPGKEEEGPDKYNSTEWKKYYEEEVKEYLDSGLKENDFAPDKIPAINRALISNAIRKGLSSSRLTLIPLFNFLYSDGHRMLSVGGMIGSSSDKRKLKKLDRERLFFLKESIVNEPYEIKVPLLTKKERLYLDKEMPSSSWTPDDFEMSSEDIEAYREIYRYYPAYTEMLL